MSYRLPPISRGQFSDSTTQTIQATTTVGRPVLFDTNDDVNGINHDVTGVTCTISQANPGVVSYTATAAFPALVAGNCVKFTTDGALPTGLTVGTAYYVITAGAGTVTVALNPGGAAIQTTSAGSGTHTMKCTHRIYLPTTGDWLAVYSIIGTANLGEHINIWAEIDETNVARSNTIVEFARNSSEMVISASFIITTTTVNQLFELYWSGEATTCQLLATGTQSNPTRPACPSALITINKISK